MCNNEDRAAFALTALTARGDMFAKGLKEAIGDLIGNLCHLAQQNGLDPVKLMRTGLSHYAVERVEPDGMFAEARVCIGLEVKARGAQLWNGATEGAFRWLGEQAERECGEDD